MTIVTAPRRLDPHAKQKVSYCVPLWLRDLQIQQNTAAVPLRLDPVDAHVRVAEPIAVVCYGPSLNDTWEQVKGFRHVISCSGAHKFLIERGIVPTWHIDVDPREHKIPLIGEPHHAVEYLLASTCHPKYFRLLLDGGYHVRLWHIFDGEDEALRVLPPGEWSLTGGCSVGLRALAIARFIGFTQLDVFGMDGCEGVSGKHAAQHPNQAPQSDEVEYEGRIYRTTAGFLEAARQTAHELDDLRDVTARFHGDGLVQAMMRHYIRKPHPAKTASPLGFNKPELISDEYRHQNWLLHQENLAYGVSASKHADLIKKLVATLKTSDGLPPSVLDYGAGKRFLAKALPFPIYEYDPAIPAIAESPKPADLVCCLDVLEHIEPDKLIFVLDDLRRCVKQMGYFVINTGPAQKTLPDGRNTHLIQQPLAWWTAQLDQFFTIAKAMEKGPEVHVLVSPKKGAANLGLEAKRVSAPSDLLLTFDGLQFRHDPYVIGCAGAVVEPSLYAELVRQFPPIELFKSFGEHNRKFSLSSVNNPNEYAKYLSKHDIWRRFHAYIKTTFIEQMGDVLRGHGVDWKPAGGHLKARWEFSALPADGGCLRPHTDIPSKLVTVVLSMRSADDTWQQEWGGGTDVLVPRIGDTSSAVMPQDYKADFDAFDVVETYPYVPNQAVVFIKTPNSWHSVGPFRGPTGVFRRTLTINIEKAL